MFILVMLSYFIFRGYVICWPLVHDQMNNYHHASDVKYILVFVCVCARVLSAREQRFTT